MSKKISLNLSSFSKQPFGRYPTDGPYCGEIYREKVLIPILNDADLDILTLNLDGLDIELGSSFLEETFGGLVRTKKVSIKIIENKLKIVSSDSYDLQRIRDYIKKAKDNIQGYAALKNG